jgi:hypothetical protein
MCRVANGREIGSFAGVLWAISVHRNKFADGGDQGQSLAGPGGDRIFGT